MSIALVDPRNSADVRGIYRLQVADYGSEELDSLKVLRESLLDTTAEIPYFASAAKDESGKVVSAMCYGVAVMKNGMAVLMAAYHNTKKQLRRRGIGRKVFDLSFDHSKTVAAGMGRKLALATAEATSDSEEFWNSLGFCRIYIGDEEFRYMQGGLAYYKSTGLPKKECGEVAEHLMVKPVHGVITVGMILDAIDSIWGWSSELGRDYFTTLAAYHAHLDYISGWKTKMAEQLLSGGRLSFLTAQERLARRAEGQTIIDHTAADE